MSTPVLKVIVVAVLAVCLAVAVTKIIPLLILGLGGYAVYKVLKKPQG